MSQVCQRFDVEEPSQVARESSAVWIAPGANIHDMGRPLLFLIFQHYFGAFRDNFVGVDVRALAGVCRLWRFVVLYRQVPRAVVRDINSLSVESMSSVFRHVIGSVSIVPMRMTKRRNILGWVCRRWRAQILADPSMWSNIYIDNRTSLNDVAWWIGKSTPLDLTIYINVLTSGIGRRSIERFLRNLADVIGPALIRCSDLTIYARDVGSTEAVLGVFAESVAFRIQRLTLDLELGSVVDQEDMEARLPMIFNGDLPTLRTLQFSRGYISWPTALFYANLDTLHLTELPYDCALFDTDLVALLSATPILRVLAVGSVDCEVVDYDQRNFQSVATTVTLGYLTHFRFSGSHHASQWVALIDAPQLRTLELSMEMEEDNVQVFASAAHRILPVITTLIFAVDVFSYHTLLDFLKVSPNLIRLDGRNAGPGFASAIHSIAVAFDQLCPLLRSVYTRNSLEMVPLCDIFNRRAFSSYSPDLHLFMPVYSTNYASRFLLYDTWMNSVGEIQRTPISVVDSLFQQAAITL
ncbi:hypothetical protein C8J57DRAFT_1417692 [Mycena rebaudengoi]|nr:hypothetical protein C8J57DRAFT_1417692 [Mycena rebaudengoi]